MLKTKSGRMSASRAGKLALASRRYDLADGAERALHRIDGGGLVPLGVEIGLRKIVAERPTVGIVGGGGVGRGPGVVSPVRSGLRLKASPIRTAKGAPLQKRPSTRDEPRRVDCFDDTKVRKSVPLAQ